MFVMSRMFLTEGHAVFILFERFCYSYPGEIGDTSLCRYLMIDRSTSCYRLVATLGRMRCRLLMINNESVPSFTSRLLVVDSALLF